AGDDAAPSSPFRMRRQERTVLIMRSRRAAGDQDPDEDQNGTENGWEKARSHMGQRAELVGLGLDERADPQQDHEAASIEVPTMHKVQEKSFHVRPAARAIRFAIAPAERSTRPRPALPGGRASGMAHRRMCRWARSPAIADGTSPPSGIVHPTSS